MYFDRPRALAAGVREQTALLSGRQWISKGRPPSHEPAAIDCRQNAGLEGPNNGLLVVAGEDADEGGNVGEVEEEGKVEKDIGGEELEREHR